MFNIGAGEMVFILVAALLILGPQRLPELARGIGKFLREFRRQTDEVRNVVEREFYAMDQEIGEPPTAPIRPGTRFAPQPPESIAGPNAPVPPVENGAAPQGDTAAPGAQPSTQVLELGDNGPRELSAADVPPNEGTAQAASAEPPAPGDEAPPEPASSSATSPTLSPIPGTVARNAPKRS